MRTSLIVALVFLASCGDDGPSADAGPGEGRWQLLGDHRPSSLLAVWAERPDNVWVVGGRAGVGMGPTVWHYDGAAWSAPDTGELNVDLWSVFGFADGTVFLGGSNGTMLRYRGGTFEKLPTPGNQIVFGIWGTSPDDVWAVGGQSTGQAFVWRYQGTSFAPVTGVPAELDTGGAVWKVTGRAVDDVWMSCSRSLVLHWDGAALSSEQLGPSAESLFGIGCNETRCVTAGGNTVNGVLYENEGQGWGSRVPTLDGPVWRGMTPTGAHSYVVGMAGVVIRRTTSDWVPDPHKLTSEALHAAWSDADGNLFAVGGKFDQALTTDGVLLYKGAAELPALP